MNITSGQEELQKQLGIDRVEVVNFVDHLRKAFEDYVNKRANEGREVRFSEAMMSAHNFYKLIILDIENRDEKIAGSEEAKRMFRRMWVDTLSIALLGTEEEKSSIRAKNQA